MQQIVDLQAHADFQALDVELLSIAFDSAEEMRPAIESMGITVPMLTDTDHQVSADYGVLQWAVATGEPGHTFILVDREGTVAWIQDYGAPQNRGVMHVDPGEIASEVATNLDN